MDPIYNVSQDIRQRPYDLNSVALYDVNSAADIHLLSGTVHHSPIASLWRCACHSAHDSIPKFRPSDEERRNNAQGATQGPAMDSKHFKAKPTY